MITEAELIKKMDAMKPKLKKCVGYEGHDCDSTFNLDNWAALSDLKKNLIRSGLDWYIKPKVLVNGNVSYTIDCRCKKCKYQHEKNVRFHGGGARRGHFGSRVRHDGPKKGSPEHTYYCTVRPTCD